MSAITVAIRGTLEVVYNVLKALVLFVLIFPTALLKSLFSNRHLRFISMLASVVASYFSNKSFILALSTLKLDASLSWIYQSDLGKLLLFFVLSFLIYGFLLTLARVYQIFETAIDDTADYIRYHVF